MDNYPEVKWFSWCFHKKKKKLDDKLDLGMWCRTYLGLRYFSTQPNVIGLRNLKSNATYDNSKNQIIGVGSGRVGSRPFCETPKKKRKKEKGLSLNYLSQVQ